MLMNRVKRYRISRWMLKHYRTSSATPLVVVRAALRLQSAVLLPAAGGAEVFDGQVRQLGMFIPNMGHPTTLVSPLRSLEIRGTGPRNGSLKKLAIS